MKSSQKVVLQLAYFAALSKKGEWFIWVKRVWFKSVQTFQEHSDQFLLFSVSSDSPAVQ